ncbi:hypothetical protein L6R52_31800 [Myxococcota bacterium]|nr:hypothetical protein [Myxococcota bacterium]
MPRFISLTVAFIAALALLSAGGYVMARWYELDAVASIAGTILKSSLYFIAAACAYAGLVGIYHVILSVTGLDEERAPPAEPEPSPEGREQV